MGNPTERKDAATNYTCYSSTPLLCSRLFCAPQICLLQVQSVFRRSPSYDLRELLGGADPSLRGVVELAEPSRGQGRMLGGGVETVWMDPDMRSRISSTLQIAEAMAAPSALYAIWLFGEQLIALAQPREPSHRLHSQDLLLLINFIATQPALRTAESWTPVCFPRFQDQVR